MSLIQLILCCALLGLVSACSTSPLYKGDPSSGYGTVPRDEMGEPIWDKIVPRDREDDNYRKRKTNKD